MAHRHQKSQSERVTKLRNLGIAPQYQRGRLAGLRPFESREWRAAKDTLKQAWIDGEWAGIVNGERANDTITRVTRTLREEINGGTLDIPAALHRKAHAYIERKAAKPSYVEEMMEARMGGEKIELYSGKFSRKGTNLNADIIRSPNGRLFRKVKLIDADLQARVAREQGTNIRVGKILGSGASGTVRLFERLSRKGAQLVAAKIPGGVDLGWDVPNDSVLKEAALSTYLPNTSNFSRLRDWAQVDGKAYFFMDLHVRGNVGELLAKMRTHHTLRQSQKITVIRDLAMQTIKAVHDMHQAGVYHGDLKPGNLLFSKDGSVVVTDWDFATRNLTAVTNRGTSAYMAPEQFNREARRAANAKDVDKYALGVTLRDFAQCLSEGDRASLVEIASALTSIDPSKRPELDHILQHSYFKNAASTGPELLKVLDGEGGGAGS